MYLYFVYPDQLEPNITHKTLSAQIDMETWHDEYESCHSSICHTMSKKL